MAAVQDAAPKQTRDVPHELRELADRLLILRSAISTACEALETSDADSRDEHIACLLRQIVCDRIDSEIEFVTELADQCRTLTGEASPNSARDSRSELR